MPDLNRPSLAELIDLNDRRSVVTGAAKGIGLAITRRLTEAGAKVAMLDIDRTALEKSADFLRKSDAQVHPFAVDITDEDAVVARVTVRIVVIVLLQRIEPVRAVVQRIVDFVPVQVPHNVGAGA